MDGPNDIKRKDMNLKYAKLTIDPTHELDLGFQVKFWNGCVSGMGGSDSFEVMNRKTVNNGMARLSEDLSAEVMLIFQIRCSFKNVKMQLAPERSSKILVWYIDCVYSL